MAGRSDPPGGPPGDVPGNGDEEFRSTVFDESFVRSAALEEFSAQQRLEDHTSPVRRRVAEAAALGNRGLPRSGLAMVAVLLTAVLLALFLGNRNPYAEAPPQLEPPPVGSLLPLTPVGAVPGGSPAELYAASPAAEFAAGPAGLPTPTARRTDLFSRDQVAEALVLAQRYVTASALTAEVLTGGTALPVRMLLRPEQQRQLDRSLAGRQGEPPVTTWLVRFDPGEVRLTDEPARVEGTFTVVENAGRLEITARHLTVYALRPAEAPHGPASLLLVRREVLLAFSEEDLREGRTVLVSARTVTGPADCAADHGRELRPLLAGAAPEQDGTEVDPFALTDEDVRPCGSLKGS